MCRKTRILAQLSTLYAKQAVVLFCFIDYFLHLACFLARVAELIVCKYKYLAEDEVFDYV